MTGIKPALASLRLWHLALAALFLAVLVFLVLRPPPERAPDFGPPPDFAAIEDTRQMKAAFFGYLSPIVRYQNDLIRRQRQHLQGIHAQLEDGKPISGPERAWLEEIAEQYELDGRETELLSLVKRLLRRVDIVPLELALAQAAMESAWGRSRFAVEANNLFGQWCYQPGCGVVPANRRAGATHEVERFPSITEAVRRYMNNLNTHERYRTVREIRAGLRASGRAVTGMALAKGLTHYSERGKQYVLEVRAMIRRYREIESSAQG